MGVGNLAETRGGCHKEGLPQGLENRWVCDGVAAISGVMYVSIIVM
jgi:hypothetical protein